jgi:hypothetical protein
MGVRARAALHLIFVISILGHATNRLRGLLCSNCNTALGLLKDSRKMLMNAISYLEVFDAA